MHSLSSRAKSTPLSSSVRSASRQRLHECSATLSRRSALVRPERKVALRRSASAMKAMMRS